MLYAAWFSLSAGALFAIMYWVMSDYTARQMDASVTAQVASLRQDAAIGHGVLTELVTRRADALGLSEYAYLLQDAAGRRIAGDLPQMTPAEGWQDLPVPDTAGVEPESGHAFRAFGTRLDDGGFLLVARDIFTLDEAMDLNERTFGFGLAVTLVLAFVGGAFVSAGFLRRLDAINRTSRDIMEGDLTRRVPVRGGDGDFDLLATNLNRMLDRIQALMENLRQVSNDIAHDLRSPLARLRQRLEGARANAHSLADYACAVDHAIAETDALLGTFGALLRIAQVESSSRRAGFAAVDLSEMVRTIVETYTPVAEDHGHVLMPAVAAGQSVRGDRDLLTQMLANLVENALCHTPVGSSIAVALLPMDNGNGPCLVVADNGPGIPEDQRERVLRRFHRLEASRTTPGCGLGLSLVVAVAELHRASLRLEDNGPGLRVAVRFPGPEENSCPAGADGLPRRTGARRYGRRSASRWMSAR